MANSIDGPFISGEKIISIADTAEPLVDAELLIVSMAIVAKSGNTGKVCIGGSDVTANTNDGLTKGQIINIPTRFGSLDLAEIYVVAPNANDGVDFYGSRT